jgi:hypothetical protein
MISAVHPGDVACPASRVAELGFRFGGVVDVNWAKLTLDICLAVL